MFDVGFQELTLIGVIALIVVGPERLPRMARTLGLWMGKVRYYVGQVKSDIEREVRAQELKEMLDKPARELDDLKSVAEETKGTLEQARGVLGEAKTAFEGASAGISTPNEPAAGSIFPTELPDVGPAQADSGPAQVDSAPVQVDSGPAQVDSGPAQSPETASVPSAEPAPVTADPEPTVRSEPESGQPDSSSVATDTGESDERSNERV